MSIADMTRPEALEALQRLSAEHRRLVSSEVEDRVTAAKKAATDAKTNYVISPTKENADAVVAAQEAYELAAEEAERRGAELVSIEAAIDAVTTQVRKLNEIEVRNRVNAGRAELEVKVREQEPALVAYMTDVLALCLLQGASGIDDFIIVRNLEQAAKNQGCDIIADAQRRNAAIRSGTTETAGVTP